MKNKGGDNKKYKYTIKNKGIDNKKYKYTIKNKRIGSIIWNIHVNIGGKKGGRPLKDPAEGYIPWRTVSGGRPVKDPAEGCFQAGACERSPRV